MSVFAVFVVAGVYRTESQYLPLASVTQISCLFLGGHHVGIK